MGVWAVSGLFVAGIVGAGFASGQELVVFFVRYGKAGIAGAVWAGLLLFFGTGLILEACARYGVSSYGELFKALNPTWSSVFENVYGLFLLVGASVMFAGMAAMGSSPFHGALLRWSAAVLVFLVLRRGIKNVLDLSVFLAPALTVALCAIAILYLRRAGINPFEYRSLGSGLVSALEAGTLYACYNLGFALAFLASTHHYLPEKSQRWRLAFLGSAVLTGSMLLLCWALATLSPEQLAQPFPLVQLVHQLGKAASRGYSLVLWCAMFSTAVANCLALTSRLAQWPSFSWQKSALVAVGLSLGCSHLGFTWLISMAYPILGLGGLWLVANLIWDALP